MASKDTELFHDVQKYSLSVAIRPVQFARIFNSIWTQVCALVLRKVLSSNSLYPKSKH